MDTKTPFIDSLETYLNIRKSFHSNTLPIIVLIKEDKLFNPYIYLNTGLNGFIKKPVQKIN